MYNVLSYANLYPGACLMTICLSPFRIRCSFAYAAAQTPNSTQVRVVVQ